MKASLTTFTMLVFGLTGCITTPDKPVEPTPEVTPQEKAGTDDPATAETQTAESAGDTGDTVSRPVPSEAEQWAFVRKHSRTGTDFEEGEHTFVGSLADKPEPGTVAEAALAIGIVKTVLHPLGGFDAPSFEESDMGTGDNQDLEETGSGYTHSPPPDGPSLSTFCEDRGINLPDALNENPLLQTSGMATQVLRALRAGPNPEEFVREVKQALTRHATEWVAVANQLGLTAPAPDTPAETTEPATDTGPGVAPSLSDIKDDDSLVMQAQELADRGDFRLAIAHARKVSEESPMFTVAQEKVREFSNRAVQDLRRKAARAFQSAMPITDVKVRAEYLEKAKTYLEEAIQNYPDASHLTTVKDNLRVISKDLERLRSEAEGH